MQAANPELSMAQIRQLTGLAFDRHEESLLGQAMRPQANPAQTQSSDAAEVAAGGRSSSGSQRAEGAAARATTDADSRANVWGPLYIQTRLETQARAEAERQEASTWANDFIANAQQAADDAEANAQASTRAAQVVEQEAAPAATDDVAPPSGRNCVCGIRPILSMPQGSSAMLNDNLFQLSSYVRLGALKSWLESTNKFGQSYIKLQIKV